MTTASDDSRLSRLEGRVEEQSAGMQEIRQDMRSGFQQVNARLDRLDPRFDRTELEDGESGRRIDWLFWATVAVGMAQIGLLATIVLRGG